MRLNFCSLLAAFAVASLASTTALAQSDKITIRMAPAPNQTVRMRLVQEMEMEMTFGGNSPLAAAMPGPMKMLTTTVLAMTQKVGAPDAQGNVESEVTYDETSSEATINSQPIPLGDTNGGLKGKKITITFDKGGNVLDVKAPRDISLPEETFRGMLNSFYANLPTTPIGVGEVANSPLDFTIPLPMSGATPMKMDGEMRHKLVSIEKDVAGRIARFDQTVDAKMVTDMEVPSPNGKIKMNLDFKMNGTGTTLNHLDKGVVKSSDAAYTFDGKIDLAGESTASQMPSITLRGKMKQTITSEN
jgi:hypothetical protein